MDKILGEAERGRKFIEEITETILSEKKITLRPVSEWPQKRWTKDNSDNQIQYLCTDKGELTILFKRNYVRDATSRPEYYKEIFAKSIRESVDNKLLKNK